MTICFHGTSALLAPFIARTGLKPNGGYVHVSSTRGLAWAYGAWAAGLTAAAGHTRLPPSLSWWPDPLEDHVRAALAKGPTAAVARLDVPPHLLEDDPQYACPALPWESFARQAPCYRSRLAIDPRHIVDWSLFRVPELDDPAMLARLTGQAADLAQQFPRGHALLEDLPPAPIGPAIPNGRALLAAVLDAAGPAADLAHHGVAHWADVADRGLDLHERADLTVVLLFALLHDACRASDGADDGHGRRAAELARALNGGAFQLDARSLARLTRACAEHDACTVSRSPTLGACFDADRLALARFGVRPRPDLMSTATGRRLARDDAPPPAEMSLRGVLDAFRARLAPSLAARALELAA